MALISIIRQHYAEILFESFEIEHDKYLCSDIDYLGWVGQGLWNSDQTNNIKSQLWQLLCK